MKLFIKILPFLYLIFQLYSCSDKQNKKELNQAIIDPNKSINTSFDGKIFSVPSPIQMAILMDKMQISFDESLLNPLENIDIYTTEDKQALNLGVYGTDIAYASINSQTNLAAQYISIIENLSMKLDLENAFDRSLFNRFEKYKTVKDSSIHIISEGFKHVDNFLKNSKRKSTSALIMAGGWIESLHFACELCKLKENRELINRIGEQQHTIMTIIEILENNCQSDENRELIYAFKDLSLTFENVQLIYEYAPPKTDEKTKTTILMHKTTTKIDPTTLDDISTKIENIRKMIIN